MDPNDIFNKDFGSTQEQQYQNNNKTIPELEKELTDKYHFKSMKDTKELYYYDNSRGIYLKGGEWLIEQACVNYFPQITTKDVTDTKNRIIWANYVDRSDFDSKIDWLCCKNVMVNLVTGEVKPHSPEFMATVQIPHDYLYNTPCVPAPARILQFFHQVMAYDDVETVLDFIAYCLWRELRFHKLLLFNGSVPVTATLTNALDYVKHVGFPMKRRTSYRHKKKIEDMKLKRMRFIAKVAYEEQHLERVDRMELIENQMWINY